MASPNLQVSSNRWRIARPSGRLSFGLHQEAMIRQGLESNPDFVVNASAHLDYLDKLDCAVFDKTRSELGWVGLQITTRDNDPTKIERTFQTLMRTRRVPRTIYLIVPDPVGPRTIAALAQVIRQVAAWPRQGMMVIRLQRTSDGVQARLLKKMAFDTQAAAA